MIDDRQTEVPQDSTLVIPDLTDATWAKIRFGPDGWQRVASVLGSITDEPALVVIYNAVRDAVRDAQLAPAVALDLLGTAGRPSGLIMTQPAVVRRQPAGGALRPGRGGPARPGGHRGARSGGQQTGFRPAVGRIPSLRSHPGR